MSMGDVPRRPAVPPHDHPRPSTLDRLARRGLTPREQTVLLAAAMRLTNREIAERLHISVRTVESHVASLLRKFDVTDRQQLVDAARALAFADVATVRAATPAEPPAAAVSVAELDVDGVIVAVNPTWVAFCHANGGTLSRCGPGVSYLDVCDRAPDELSHRIGQHIRDAARGGAFVPRHAVVPCHAPDERRWYDMVIASTFEADGRCTGVSVSLARVGGTRTTPV